MARAYLYSDLSETERAEAEHVLTGLLDDPSPLVRRALAESFAGAAEAPHHILLALAEDQSDVSAIVLSRSLGLSEAELINCAAIGDAIAQSAIALRPHVGARLAAALAEIGAREAAISLAVNPGADLPEFSLRRMLQRFGGDGELREALLTRPNLPAVLRADLVAATADALSAFVTRQDWISAERAARIAREAREQAHIIIAATSGEACDGARQLAAHLRESRQLTAGLLLRSLLSGNDILFEASLVELSGLAPMRVRGLMRDWRSAGFAALYRKAGLPESLLFAFRAGLEALFTIEIEGQTDGQLSRQRIAHVLHVCAQASGKDSERLLALLRRFEAEAARAEARSFSEPAQNRSVATRREPLLLPDFAEEVESPGSVRTMPRRGEPRIITIDFAAIEAELAAA